MREGSFVSVFGFAKREGEKRKSAKKRERKKQKKTHLNFFSLHLSFPPPRNQTKPNQTNPNQTKPNQTKPNQIKPNQTKPNQTNRRETNPHQGGRCDAGPVSFTPAGKLAEDVMRKHFASGSAAAAAGAAASAPVALPVGKGGDPMTVYANGTLSQGWSDYSYNVVGDTENTL